MSDSIYPDIIIGGAQKCGTSALAIWMDEHPQLLCSKPKEPDYFSKQNQIEQGRGYAAYYPSIPENSDKYLFEASTGYFVDSIAAQAIKNKFEDNLKLIFILRCPIERTISAYYHMFKHYRDKRDISDVFKDLPREREKVFEHENMELLKAEKAGKIESSEQAVRYDDPLLQFRYIYNSFYARHYAVYNNLFNINNILLLNLDALHKDPEAWFKKITDFLDIEAFKTLPDAGRNHNHTKIKKYLLNRHIRANEALVGVFDKIYLAGKKAGLQKHFLTNAPDCPGPIKNALEELFEPEIKMLKNL